MRGKSLIITGASVAAALAVAAPSAQAAIAGGQFLTTETRPDLVSITVGENSDTETPKEVRYCFDINVYPNPAAPQANPNGEGMRYQPRYEIQGYDVDTSSVTTNTVVDDDENENCVIAIFPDNTTLNTRTVGTVAENAVLADFSGKGNLVDAAALGGGGENVLGGFTTGPDLLSATVQPSFNRIRIVFDRRVRDLDWTEFSYVDAAGNREFGVANNGLSDSFISGDDSRVVYIAFDEAPNQSVRDAVRLELDDEGVFSESQTGGGEPNQLDSVAIDGQDGLTARPDLLGASVVGGGQNAVDFLFDQRVEDPNRFAFDLIRDTGENETPTQVVVLQSGGSARTIIRAYFNNDGEDFLADGETARVAVDFDAVEAQNDGLTNTIGSVDIGSVRGVNGSTSAPDATSVTFDSDSGTMLLTFDQAIDIDELIGGRLRVVDRFGNTINSPILPDIVQELSAGVRVHIGSDVAQNAVGVSIDNGLFEGDDDGDGDDDADENVRQSIGRVGAVGSPGPGPIPTDNLPSNPPAGGGQQGPAPQAPAPAAQQVAAAGGAAPTARVSPARSGKSAKARVLYAKYRKGSLTAKISSKAKKVKIRISLRNKKGKTIKTVTRTVRTNRQVTLKNLTRSSKVKSVKVRVL